MALQGKLLRAMGQRNTDLLQKISSHFEHWSRPSEFKQPFLLLFLLKLCTLWQHFKDCSNSVNTNEIITKKSVSFQCLRIYLAFPCILSHRAAVPLLIMDKDENTALWHPCNWAQWDSRGTWVCSQTQQSGGFTLVVLSSSKSSMKILEPSIITEQLYH